MNQTSSSQSHSQPSGETGENVRAIDNLSLLGEWIAPIVVWVVVIALILAIAGFLLGDA